MRTDEFEHALPRGPLTQLLLQVHALIEHIEACGKAGVTTENPWLVIEHSLREIAIYTQEDERYGPPRLRSNYVMPGAQRTTVPNDFGKAIQAAAKNMLDGLAKMKAKRNPEQRERALIRNHEERIKDERRAGLAFVKAYATKTRKELRDEIHINVPENRSTR